MNPTRDMSSEASTCLMMDSCDRWRLANVLTDADYPVDEAVFHCPLLNSDERRKSEAGAKASPTKGNLRMCYARGERGYNLIYSETRRELNNLFVLGSDEDGPNYST